MKYFVLILTVLFSMFNSSTIAQTIDISNLNEYEHKVHRVAWCRILAISEYSPQGYDRKRIFDLCMILNSNSFFDDDENGVQYASADDVKKN